MGVPKYFLWGRGYHFVLWGVESFQVAFRDLNTPAILNPVLEVSDPVM